MNRRWTLLALVLLVGQTLVIVPTAAAQCGAPPEPPCTDTQGTQPPPGDGTPPPCAPDCPRPPCAPDCPPPAGSGPNGTQQPPPCAPDCPRGMPCDSSAGTCPPPPAPCPAGEPCGPHGCEPGTPCGERPPCDPSRPCDAAPGCTPDAPCRPATPPNCEPAEDGAMMCSPPADCASRSDAACTPPPWCEPAADGTYTCKPPEKGAFGGPGAACAPPSKTENVTPEPCGPPMVRPPCHPSANGTLLCEPPPNCGGTAFGGAGAAGCAPPEFCTATADGMYECRPPEDCRGARCGPAPIGAACERLLEDEAASGAFVPCAAPPTQFCPPPPPGAAPDFEACRPAALALRFCAPGEPQFPPDHPMGTPPVCVLPPHVEGGRYLPPGQVLKGECVPPPPGEWPPAEPAPVGKVYCPPEGFAPRPMNETDLEAWKTHMREQLTPEMAAFIEKARNGEEGNATDAASAFGLMGRPQFDGRRLNGTFVASQIDEGLAMRDFEVAGMPFFRDVRPQFQGNATFSAAIGSTLVTANDDASVETHNVPSGLLAYRGVGDAAFTIEFGIEDGFEVGTPANGVTSFTNGDWTGVIVGDASVHGDTIEADVTGESPVYFMAIPPGTIEADTRLGIAEAVADGRVFAEISLVERDDTLAEDVTYYDDASVFDVSVTEVTEDAITIDVSGEGDGQALVFTVDRETLTTPLSELVVEIDGEAIPECLDANGEPMAFMEETDDVCYQVEATEAVVRVAANVEHFSSHTLVIGAPQPETQADAGSDEESAEAPAAAGDGATDAPSKDTPGIGALGIVGAVALVALVAGRRKQR